VRDTYLAGRKLVLNKGDLVRFWKDSWTGDPPWCDQFPVLFDICQMQNCTIRQFVDNNIDLPFGRWKRAFIHDLSMLGHRIKNKHHDELMAWIGSLY
jgi:hypothetical protein